MRKMCRSGWKMLVLALGIALARNAGAAEAVRFVHERSAYADNQSVPLNHPEGVACGPDSIVVVADTGNGRLVLFKRSADALTEGSEIKAPQLQYPVRVHIGSKGDILVLDGKLRGVLRISPAGTFLGAVEPKGVPKGTVLPKSFALDKEDNLYFLDNFSKRVVVADLAGGYRREIPFPETSGLFSDLAVDSRGTVLLLDSIAGTLYAAEKGGETFTLLAKDLKEYAGFPAYLTTDERGTIYVVDQNGGGVLILGQDGTFLGRQLAMGWKEGLLYYPSQMCVAGGEAAIIADRENNRVQVFRVIR